MASLDVIVVDLPRRRDRRERLAKILPDRWDVEFLSDLGLSVDHQALNRRLPPGVALFPWPIRSSNRLYARPLKWGEVACSLAHINAWRRIVRRGLNRCLVLEDDVFFHPDIHDVAASYCSEIDKCPDWGLFYLGRIRKQLEEEPEGNLLVPGYSYCSYAYLLSGLGAATLLEQSLEKRLIPVDEFLPAMYLPHPRIDVRAAFPPSLKAFGLYIDIVHQLDRRVAGSETEMSDFVNDESPPDSRVPSYERRPTQS